MLGAHTASLLNENWCSLYLSGETASMLFLASPLVRFAFRVELVSMKAKGICFVAVAAPFLWVGCGDDTTGRVNSSQQRSIVAPASITQNDFTLHEDNGGISTLRLDLVNQFTLTRPGFTPLSGNFSNPVQNGNSFTLTLISPEQQDSLLLNYITVQSGNFTLTPPNTNSITGTFTSAPIAADTGAISVSGATTTTLPPSERPTLP
ncbi:MAG: hypothetical protein JWM99_1164 [Verrucomicrobiales bacterium]|nr:hypothetical protein [Verrucomicrobiales bacterium]